MHEVALGSLATVISYHHITHHQGRCIQSLPPPLVHNRYYGVMNALISLGVVVPSHTKVGGVSAGALAGSAVCSGLASLDDAIDASRQFARACNARGPGGCFGRTHKEVRACMQWPRVGRLLRPCA